MTEVLAVHCIAKPNSANLRVKKVVLLKFGGVCGKSNYKEELFNYGGKQKNKETVLIGPRRVAQT